MQARSTLELSFHDVAIGALASFALLSVLPSHAQYSHSARFTGTSDLYQQVQPVTTAELPGHLLNCFFDGILD